MPTTTAVLATPPTRPGPLRRLIIFGLRSLSRSDHRFARGLDDLVRDPIEIEHDAAGIAHLLRDIACPHVLPHEQRGRRVQLELLAGRGQVFLVEESLHLDAGPLESGPDLGIQVVELERENLSVGVLADEREVDDPDRACVDEVRERRGDLAAELVARERDDQVVDWADFIHAWLPS